MLHAMAGTGLQASRAEGAGSLQKLARSWCWWGVQLEASGSQPRRMASKLKLLHDESSLSNISHHCFGKQSMLNASSADTLHLLCKGLSCQTLLCNAVLYASLCSPRMPIMLNTAYGLQREIRPV